MRVRWCDEFDGGFGWIVDEFLERCSHALVVGDHVWLIDPVDGDGVEDRVRSAGTPAGVIQLLDRHNRHCATLAARLGVPLHVVPRQPIPPFDFIPIRDGRFWKEVALWWPQPRVLVSADALGTSRYFHTPNERLAVHPFLRLRPPRRQLEGLAPEWILCGHGEGIHDDATSALQDALGTARRRIPAQVVASARGWFQGRRGS